MKKKAGEMLKFVDNVTKIFGQKSLNVDSELHGHIDRVETGVAFGWAASKTSSDPLLVNIVINEKTVGHGKADKFRSDLKEAGVHKGRHAFEIAMSEIWDEDSEIELILCDAESGLCIPHPKFKMTVETQRFTGELVRVQDGHIVANISSNHPIGKKEIILYHEDTPVFQQEIETRENSLKLSLPVPVRLMDGHYKLFKLGMEGRSNILATQWFDIHPIQTPWQYLKESYAQPGFLSLPKQASHRYESLHYHMEAIVKNAGVLSEKDILKVHNIVAESCEGRKKFPGFSLPAFEKPRVSIIVPAYNKFELTYHCIASIALAFNKSSYEVILADDCSTDDTENAANIIDNLIVSRNPENLRFLLSCNRASELAKGDYIVFLNNDTEVTSFWLDELVDKMDQDPGVGMTGSKLLNLDGSLQEAGGIVWGSGEPWNVGRNANTHAPEYNYVRDVDYLSGAAMCVRKSVWQKVGKFSEELAPCYYEDTDLAFKIRKAGLKTVYVPQSVVIHFEGQSHGRDINSGLKRYQKINEKTFRTKWFKDYKNNGKASLENLAIEKDRNIDHRVLVIDYASPMPDKDAGSYAAFQEIKLIQSLGFKVTFVSENMAHFGKYTTNLQRIGAEVLYTPFYTSVYDVLQKRLHEMDAVYITRYGVAEKYIDTIRNNSNAKILFNNADLHFLREMRTALKQGKDNKALEKALQTREKELQVCRKVDAVLCYNATEHAVITSHILEFEKLHITPWVLPEKAPGPDYQSREGITFLGGYNHHPNVEAVKYLAKEIMPLLAKKRPDICLYVYGSNMPEEFETLEDDNIKMVGFAEHLDDVYHQHRVFVAPLLSGAGIKGKVLEAMAYGLPTVLTEIAAEGTGLTHGISALLADKPGALVKAIVKLYDDKTLWKKCAENEKALAKEMYSFAHGQKQFKEIFSSVGLYSAH